ncbi:ribosomal protein S18 acetylase RimI-like enzyme [Knoellia remsis]|uniref:Ribosomal protein S18 acetylase RimI-like enzyme n=1 Tax=Knoellia remsis TaxID=407159 RepID=A0A2T0UU62_9MICO|nr:GNAT family N-acetyltransferase [Knoellia remsis]PRY61465.1 ribosomal protein S18 acetylase RimI-like enzyme [Knoellia remsis]
MGSIRFATAADLPGLAAVEASGDALSETVFGPLDWPPPATGEWRAAQPGFLLVTGDPVVGFAHVLVIEGHWHLEQLVVDPAHGRRGLGSALLDAVCREVASRGGESVTLRTYADVPWNAPFYARHGFTEVASEPAWMAPLRATEERIGLMRHGRRIAMHREC